MIEPDQVVDGVEVYVEWQLLDEISPEWTKKSYDQNQAEVTWWCEVNAAHYYAAPHDDFSVYEAAEQAKALGLNKVVVDDLS